MVKSQVHLMTLNKEDDGVRLGQVYGHLTVMADVSSIPLPGGHYTRQYLCECDCPNHTMIHVVGARLKNGMINDCGCVREYARRVIEERKLYTAGKKKNVLTPEKAEYFRVFAIQSCYNSAHNFYLNGNGQNIQVCPQWQDPVNGVVQFYQDMAPTYTSGSDLGRIDENGDFTPENCCWISHEQHMRRVKDKGTVGDERLEFDGYNLSLSEWGGLIGSKPLVFKRRQEIGWPTYEVLYGKRYVDKGRCMKNGVYFFDDYGRPLIDQTKVTKQWKGSKNG